MTQKFAHLIVCLGVFIPVASRGGPSDMIPLPEPSGPHAVGYAKFAVEDSHRAEPLTKALDDHRELLLEIWYPAEPGTGAPRPYMEEAVASAWSQRHPVPAGFAARVRPNARRDATLIRRTERLPLVVFSHGMTFPPSNYQTLFESLASHGYVVVAINHTYALHSIVFPDGRETGWALWAPSAFETEAERQSALAAHMSTWVADIRFVVDVLLDARRAPALLRDRLEGDCVGVFGHSYGATAGAYALHADPRICAAVAMEGAVYDKDNRPMPVRKPLLYMIGGYNMENSLAEYRPSPGPYYELVIERTMHVAFGDLLAVYRHFADDAWHQRRASDTNFEQVVRIINAYARAFLDRFVRKDGGAIIDPETQPFPEARLFLRTPSTASD